MGNHCLGVSRRRNHTGLFGITEMNERIKQLEKQSYTEVMHEMGGAYMAFDKEKFTELIVRECARIAAYQGACLTEYKILKHFGVEE